MILLPYIKEKCEKNEYVIIKTEKNLEDTINILISRTNFSKDQKEKIMSLNWKNENQEFREDSNIIIIGSKKFIENQNREIENQMLKNVIIIDCYELNEIQEEVTMIKNKYKKSLNSIGIAKF